MLFAATSWVVASQSLHLYCSNHHLHIRVSQQSQKVECGQVDTILPIDCNVGSCSAVKISLSQTVRMPAFLPSDYWWRVHFPISGEVFRDQWIRLPFRYQLILFLFQYAISQYKCYQVLPPCLIYHALKLDDIVSRKTSDKQSMTPRWLPKLYDMLEPGNRIDL